MPSVVKLTTLQTEAGDPTLIQRLAPVAWAALSSSPGVPLSAVKNRRLYVHVLQGIVGELLSILDLAWSQHPRALEVTLA